MPGEESEVEDIVQEVWMKSFQKLSSFRGDAPFEHWLMRLAVPHRCYDFLREATSVIARPPSPELSEPESDWLDPLRDRAGKGPTNTPTPPGCSYRPAARPALPACPARHHPALEIEDRSVKEISRS